VKNRLEFLKNNLKRGIFYIFLRKNKYSIQETAKVQQQSDLLANAMEKANNIQIILLSQLFLIRSYMEPYNMLIVILYS
jgi:hypothetical protein